MQPLRYLFCILKKEMLQMADRKSLEVDVWGQLLFIRTCESIIYGLFFDAVSMPNFNFFNSTFRFVAISCPFFLEISLTARSTLLGLSKDLF